MFSKKFKKKVEELRDILSRASEQEDGKLKFSMIARQGSSKTIFWKVVAFPSSRRVFGIIAQYNKEGEEPKRYQLVIETSSKESPENFNNRAKKLITGFVIDMTTDSSVLNPAKVNTDAVFNHGNYRDIELSEALRSFASNAPDDGYLDVNIRHNFFSPTSVVFKYSGLEGQEGQEQKLKLSSRRSDIEALATAARDFPKCK